MNLVERLKEPSTWVSISVILALVGLGGPSEYIAGNTETIILVISGICALVGFKKPEGKAS